MCEANDETITDIISEFPKLLHKEYKRKHEFSREMVQIQTFTLYRKLVF